MSASRHLQKYLMMSRISRVSIIKLPGLGDTWIMATSGSKLQPKLQSINLLTQDKEMKNKPMEFDLRLECKVIRRKGFCLHQDFKPTRRGGVKGHHEEMQVGRQRIHHGYFVG